MLQRVLHVRLTPLPDGDSDPTVFLESLAEEILREGGTDLLLKRSIIERVLMDRLTNQASCHAVEHPVDYLINCYRRILEESRKVQGMKNKTLSVELQEALSSVKELVVSYTGLLQIHPDMFPQPGGHQPIPSFRRLVAFITGGGSGGYGGDLTDIAFSGSSTSEGSGSSGLSLPPGFLDQLVQRFDGEGLEDIFRPVFAEILAPYHRISPLGPFHRPLQVMVMLVSYPPLAKVLANHPQWLPTSDKGRAVDSTILGRFLRITPIPDPSDLFLSPVPSVRECFSKPSQARPGDINATFQTIRTVMHQLYEGLLEILKILLKGSETRENVLQFLGTAVEKNKDRGKMQMNPNSVATHGTFMSLSWIMLKLCEPFLDPLSSKKDRIDYSYVTQNNRVNFSDLTAIFATSDEVASWVDKRNYARTAGFRQLQQQREQEELKRMGITDQAQASSAASSSSASPSAPQTARSSPTPPPGQFHFICECFFLTARVLNLGLLKVVNVMKELSEFAQTDDQDRRPMRIFLIGLQCRPSACTNGRELKLQGGGDCSTMAGGSSARGAIAGQGSRRQLERGEGSGKDIASSSTPSRVTSKDLTPATDPSLFVPQPEERQKKLQAEKEIWKRVEQGQEAVPKGQGEYWLRCRLCSTIWRGTSTRAVEHFLKMLKSCPFRTGEIVHKLVAQGVKVLRSDKKTLYLLQNYRQLHNIKEGGAAANDDGADAVVRRGYEEPQPPVAAGREAVEETAQRGKESAAGETLREECQSTTRAALVQQTTSTRWVDNAAQKKLDIAWAKAMFRAGITLNFLNLTPLSNCTRSSAAFDCMLGCHGLHFRHGRADRSEGETCHEFLGGGGAGSGAGGNGVDGWKEEDRTSAGQTLGEDNEGVRINAICTDNAEVNKKAAQILERRTDLAVSRIPWVPCAAHCCSLLLRDISKLDWIKGTVNRSHTIVKFIRNHHCTHSLMMSLDDSLSLLRPTEVRFGSVYMMMERFEGWWPELKKVVEVMEPLYVLLRRMDKDGTAPLNLVEYDRLTERMLGEVMLTEEQRRTVLEKAIAMKVMGMWSTATPAERNWSSMDLVHSKRRNRLNPSTLEKLVYIHWNMQLLHSGKNLKDAGYIDLWAQFFESLPEPEVDDGSILKDPVEEKDKTEDELVRERAFIKTPKGRIPKSLEDEEEEEECTDDSDLDDEVWKGKTPWSETSSEGEVDESSDDDFELGIPTSIPCTTYVGRREAAQRCRERPPTTPSQCTTNTTAHYNIQLDVEVPQTDTDMEMVLHRRPIDTNEEEVDRAKAWADADQERVQRRMREEEERRAAIPTRRELEKLKKKVGEQESEPVGNMGRLEEEKEEAMGQ
ncbi:hypothetical protein CBR_g12111 [Chara braunii]|uniref:DUF659 domain-containing protein n=1 Tax=Chara braunii TaxID=69332 RepID=A0A388KR43_CHABU|nr:hypothetical protein CBR_g12111 [Chara braunii]|eukprot:GBG72540.1 hypothetical protein CBR_g12111 [Chara braunii]